MAEATVTIPEGKLLDYIDGKLRGDTPEEYVRQTVERRLVREHKYKREQIGVEYTLQVGGHKTRADLVVFEDGCTDPAQQTPDKVRIIIECKRETVEPRNKKDGVAQLQFYMNACVNCEWGMWTNGRQKEVLRRERDVNGNLTDKEYNDIPSAGQGIDEIDRPDRSKLLSAVGDNLLFAFRICHNHIYVNDGLQKQPAFFELLKLIFCKLEDEKKIGRKLSFYATSKERSNTDGQLTVKKRISGIFELVKRDYGRIFEPNDEIRLMPRSLAYVVSELQKYSLLKTNIDIKGKAYEEVVGANLRGDRGEFFTPRNVMKMVVAMVNPKPGERVLDSSCGTGGFLVVALIYVIGEMEKAFERELGLPRAKWNSEDERLFLNQAAECAKDFFGFDINPDLVKATIMNMVMNNGDDCTIQQNNSLLPPHEWTIKGKTRLADALGIDRASLRGPGSLGHFDVIVTNPPFGSKIPMKDEQVLAQYDLAHIWEYKNKKWRKTDRLQSSVPPEILFIERCLQLLRPGGRLGIVLPDAILGSPGLGYIRAWLLEHTKIIASVDLHVDTFQPRNGTQTSVLVLQKRGGDCPDDTSYNIFMAQVDRIGHDKRGNPLFVRDEEGSEILVPELETTYAEEPDGTEIEVVTEQMVRIEDDQTWDVAEAFTHWKLEEEISW